MPIPHELRMVAVMYPPTIPHLRTNDLNGWSPKYREIIIGVRYRSIALRQQPSLFSQEPSTQSIVRLVCSDLPASMMLISTLTASDQRWLSRISQALLAIEQVVDCSHLSTPCLRRQNNPGEVHLSLTLTGAEVTDQTRAQIALAIEAHPHLAVA